MVGKIIFQGDQIAGRVMTPPRELSLSLLCGLDCRRRRRYWYARTPAAYAGSVAASQRRAGRRAQDPLLPRSERSAALVGSTEEGCSTAATICRSTTTRKSRSIPAGTKPQAAANGPRKILYYRNPMGLPDTSPVPKKDCDGDGLHRRLRGRGAGRRQDRQGQPRQVQRSGVRTEAVEARVLVQPGPRRRHGEVSTSAG